MTPDAADPSQPIGLIGGIGLTEVHVYAQHAAPDGLFSGCPHVHAVTDEGYFVLQGTGYVEFHDVQNGYRRLDLRPGDYMHFPPLVMHRLVSDGDLVILGMMGNAGLAERGEARIYFGQDVDANADRFNDLVSLPKRLGLDGALQRRDAAVAGYQTFMRWWAEDRAAYFAELGRFIDTHCAAMAKLAGEFTQRVQHGPLAWATATQDRIHHLPQRSNVLPNVSINRRDTEFAFGMCGILRPILTLENLALQNLV